VPRGDGMNSTDNSIPGRSLTGQVAVITGAGSATGIGFASARRLAAMGAAVVITSTTDRGGNCVIDDKAHHK